MGLVAVGAPAALAQFNPVTEQQNFSKTEERQNIYLTPQYQVLLQQMSTQNTAAALAIKASDPERQFYTDVCWNYGSGCAGDVRLYDWGPNGLRDGPAGAVDGAERRHDLRPRVGDPVGAARSGPRS